MYILYNLYLFMSIEFIALRKAVSAWVCQMQLAEGFVAKRTSRAGSSSKFGEMRKNGKTLKNTSKNT